MSQHTLQLRIFSSFLFILHLNPYLRQYKHLYIQTLRIVKLGQFSNVFGNLFGDSFGAEVTKTVKSAVDSALKTHGLETLDKELENDKAKIIELLNTNFSQKQNIYLDLNYTHKERMIASKVMDKYIFLYFLLTWLDDKEDNKFEYYNLKNYDA